MTKLRVLDLFSGIGGFSLGLERTGGFETVAMCEIEPYCRKVLAKHWPGVKCYDDVRTLTAARLAADGIGKAMADAEGGNEQWTEPKRNNPERSKAAAGNSGIDVITGGFPCQDISFAGKGAGIEGERSGLWGEYARLIGEIRPRYAIIENVSALLVRGIERVLWDLAALGYDAEWHCIPAAYVGAPHRRDRIWIVAYPQHSDADDAGSHRAPLHFNGDAEFRHQQVGEPGQVCAEVPDSDLPRLEGWDGGVLQERAGECTAGTSSAYVSDADCSWETPGRADGRMGWTRQSVSHAGRDDGGWWRTEPDVGRVAHGIPRRVDRLKGLGNAVVPQIPELIGRAILQREDVA